MIDRRSFLRMGLAAIAAPAIVRATSLMPIKVYREGWFLGDGVALQSASHPTFTFVTHPQAWFITNSELSEASLEKLSRLQTEALMHSLSEARNSITRKVLGRLQRPADADQWYGVHGV